MARCLCAHCEQPIQFAPALAGQHLACPACGEMTVLQSDLTPVDRPSRTVEAEAARAPDNPAPPSGTSEVICDVANRLRENVERVVVGKSSAIQLAIVAWLTEGHLLLEDVPGVAKTMLARALAQSVGARFKRIQCTPDLLPGEITGISVFNPKTADFEFRAGPVFANIVLADEINRATPRAQSAFLEAMAERRVSVDGHDHELAAPFFVIATQNPIDHEGTFPLPEAQLDRFIIKMSIGYPGLRDEQEMLARNRQTHPIDALESVVSTAELLEAQRAVREIMVHERVSDYIVRLIHATRAHASVRLGGSPRASSALMRAAQAFAGVQGFDHVLPDDVKAVAPHILGHRLIIQPESRLRRVTTDDVIHQVLNEVEVPSLPQHQR